MCEREQLPATLVYIDLLDFNAIVSQFGHKEGNRALNDFGQLMSGVLRSSDVKARLEWDRFTVLMAGANAAQAMKTLESIRTLLNEFNIMNETPYQLDFKFGSAGFDPRAPRSTEQLIDDAKAALRPGK
jgi:diguanylate cyclase (GGDEF)-like protein